MDITARNPFGIRPGPPKIGGDSRMDTTSNAKSFVFPPPWLCASMGELRGRRASPWQKRTATRRRTDFLVIANFISILPIGSGRVALGSNPKSREGSAADKLDEEFE